jgi:hypothetical protein
MPMMLNVNWFRGERKPAPLLQRLADRPVAGERTSCGEETGSGGTAHGVGDPPVRAHAVERRLPIHRRAWRGRRPWR